MEFATPDGAVLLGHLNQGTFVTAVLIAEHIAAGKYFPAPSYRDSSAAALK